MDAQAAHDPDVVEHLEEVEEVLPVAHTFLQKILPKVEETPGNQISPSLRPLITAHDLWARDQTVYSDYQTSKF